MLSSSPKADGRPLVLAHRGASADAPENTMAAFRAALAQGADGFELDVWRCRSGEVVVVHDESAARTTGVPFSIPRTPWKELRRLDAGAWRGEAFTGERLPLLGDVLDAFPRAVVNVELKSNGAGDPLLAVEVGRIVRAAAGRRERLLVSSFDPLLLAAFRASAPRVATAALLATDQRWQLRAAVGRLLGVAALNAEWPLATAERAARWRASGYAVNVWTVDDERRIAALCEAGVDGVITNRPAAARDAVRAATGR